MILYEDKDIIVCHKKAGIPVQSAKIGQKDMVSMLNNHLAEHAVPDKKEHASKGPQEIHVVHRLDQPVEGVIVFAKNKKAAASLGKQITEGSMKKIYQSVVCVTERGKELLEGMNGEEEISCILEDYLLKNGKMNTSAVVDKNTADAKRAELSFSVLNGKEEEQKEYALVRVHLKTGRHHQIRVQMANAGLPLYGDQKYNENWQAYIQKEEEQNELFGYFGSAPAKKNPALALCSVKLQFKHPVSGKEMIFETKPTTEAFQLFE